MTFNKDDDKNVEVENEIQNNDQTQKVELEESINNEKKTKKSDLFFLMNGGTIEEINKNKKIEKEVKIRKEEIEKITEEIIKENNKENNSKNNKKVSKNNLKKRKFLDLNVPLGVGLNFDND